MRRGAKPRRAKGDTRRPGARTSPKNEASGRRELEQRLAESLEREKATSELLQEKDRALIEAHARATKSLEQQSATSDILRVIGRSQTDVQPVFDAILASAVRLLDGHTGALTRLAGDQIELAAFTVTDAAGDASLRAIFPQSLHSEAPHAQVIRDRAPLNIADAQTDSRVGEGVSTSARRRGYRSWITVPMLRHDAAVGTIAVTRREPGAFTDDEIALLKTFADQAVIAIENVRLFKELEARNRDLTATGEVLQVISRSPTDIQPVLDTVAENAARLCAAQDASIFRRDGNQLLLVAHHGPIDFGPVGESSLPLVRGTANGRSVLDGRTIHVVDLPAEVDEFPEGSEIARRFGHRTVLNVPLMREGVAIGSISIRRTEAHLFTDQQIGLLQTFADQAVIAIENVRLFKELEARNRDLSEALEQQTATSEILRVISQSPTNLQPVLDTVAANAARLCESVDAQIFQIDGHVLRPVAWFGSLPKTTTEETRPIGRGSVNGRAVVERRTIHIQDLAAESETEWPEAAAFQKRFGHRSIVATPLLREGTPIGAITIRRMEVRPFSDQQIKLLETFADQAVIAIENVRLFTETKEALEQQTATADILRVISRSPSDIQPVFDAIVQSAVKLCEGMFGTVLRLDGDRLHLAAHHNLSPAGLQAYREHYPVIVNLRETVASGAILDRRVVQVVDSTDPVVAPRSVAMARATGFRGVIVVPMLRDGEPIGVINVARQERGPFTDRQVALLQTFADQAVIAVENVRLFKELERRNRDLTATSEILRVISSSPTDVQPVFSAIADSAAHLTGAVLATVYEFDGSLIHLRVLAPADWPHGDDLRHNFPRAPAPDFAAGRVIIERAVLQGADLWNDPDTPELTRAWARRMNLRSVLWVPMFREGEPIGVIGVTRRESGFFPDEQVRLLQTFADQAVIAVENVRLFKALQARTGELTHSVEKLTALGEVSRAVTSTLDVETVLDTIVSRANQLAGADGCAIFEYDEGAEQFELRATHNYDAEFVEALRGAPLRKGEGLMGRAAEMREPVQVADITQPGAYQSSARETLIRFGYRAVLSVPLLREDQIIGSLSFNRKAPGEFPLEVVEVLTTFATQSALAIQNARLFREIADKSAQLEAASRHKSEFLANMSHELRTPLNAIIGFSEILAEKMFGDINDKQTEYLQDILESGRHLLSLINDILDLSKIEAGRMELEVAEFDLPTAIDNALVLVRERASRREIKLGSSIDRQLGVINGDERKVKQVLLNLLSNALKFTPEGGRIDVTARAQHGAAEIAVTDTGVGIAPKDQEVVFEEFRQVGTADKKVEGTGLGLALSRKFIELHGGRIWVKSELGVGSTFTFTLPLRG